MSQLLSRTVPAVVIAASTLVLVACTGGHSHISPKASSPAPTTAPIPQYTGPAEVPNDAALRKYVTMTTCSQTASGWAAGGTATSPQNAPKTYAISVFFITDKGTVMAAASTKVSVAAHGHKTWRAAAAFAAPPNTRCVLRGVA